ncbi:MAG: SRPBCC family protein [Chloroflexota bacterium]|nr:SRPBCC family protein [Dehalococcoidia bacterium]MDW8255088.1 SRPBCC family protein [Chloroflexota bacterium]
MPELYQEVIVTAPVDEVYPVVAEVEKYPEFLPDVKTVRREGDLVEMTVQAGPLELTWVHHATFVDNREIRLTLVRGPFRRLDGCWTFTPVEGGTRVSYRTVWDLDLPLPGASLLVARALKANIDGTIRAFARRIRDLRRARRQPAAPDGRTDG